MKSVKTNFCCLIPREHTISLHNFLYLKKKEVNSSKNCSEILSKIRCNFVRVNFINKFQ